MFKILKSFIQNKSGSILPTFVIVSIPLMGIAGAALDYTYLARNATQVSNFADAALLSIAGEASDLIQTQSFESAREEIEALLIPLLTESLSSDQNMSYKIHEITYDAAAGGLKVDIEVIQFTTLLKIAKIDEIKKMVTTGISIAGSLNGPLSIAFVLDKSSSMMNDGKWDSLTSAVTNLSIKFQDMDPDEKYIRAAAWVYSDTSESLSGYNWGMSDVVTAMNNLTPFGWTNSSGAMAEAYESLRLNDENLAHEEQNSGNIQKYIIFLTDGLNNVAGGQPSTTSINDATKATCTAAKADGIEIFAIAFGDAASNAAADLMQECASDNEHFYLAADAGALNEAFDQIGQTTEGDFYLSH